MTDHTGGSRHNGAAAAHTTERELHLRRAARRALERGRVPLQGQTRCWGGQGSGGDCPICDEPLVVEQLELELEFESAAGDTRIYHLHVRCYAAWHSERLAFEPAGASSAATPVAANAVSAPRNGFSLPQRANDGNMPTRERATDLQGQPAK